MRILVTTSLFPPDIGGPATYVPRIAAYLAQQGHEICVIAPQEKDQPCPIISPPYKLIRFERAHFLRYLNYFIELWRAFRAMQKEVLLYDLIYINGLDMVAAIISAWFGKSSVTKVVGDGAWELAHNRGWTRLNLDDFQNAPGLRFKFLRKVRHMAACKAQAVIAPSRYLAKIVVGWGIPTNRINVIYNATHLPVPEPGTQIPFKFEGGLRLVTVGRLVAHKRVDGILSILPRLPHANLTIIGSGPERSKLEALAQSLEIENRVHFTGQLPPATVRQVLENSADIFVLNSTYEGLPHVLLEAASYGVPIVATNVGGTGEVVQHKQNGLLIPPDDPEALLEALTVLYNNPALAKRLAQNAYQKAAEFSLERMFQETESALIGAAK